MHACSQIDRADKPSYPICSLYIPTRYTSTVATTLHVQMHACHQIDCANKPGESLLAELFGRGSKEGLLHWVGEGSVMLKNVHKVGDAMAWSLDVMTLAMMTVPILMTMAPCISILD